MPDPYQETSVARIQDLSDEEVWSYGEKHVLQASNRGKIYGRSEILAGAVLELKLSISPDNPPPRHAVIRGWPAEKDARKAIALELANRATLKLR